MNHTLMKLYDISEYTKQQALRLGVEIKPSENPKKKLDVFKHGKKIASVGARGFMDYPTYFKKFGSVVARNRRKAYKIRHAKNRKRKGTPGYFADQLLW